MYVITFYSWSNSITSEIDIPNSDSVMQILKSNQDKIWTYDVHEYHGPYGSFTKNVTKDFRVPVRTISPKLDKPTVPTVPTVPPAPSCNPKEAHRKIE